MEQREMQKEGVALSTRIPTRRKNDFTVMDKLQQQLPYLLEKARPYACQGHVPDDIPGLKKVNPQWLGMTIVSASGKEIAVGDVQVRFPLQSIAKVFALAQALMDQGVEELFRHVGMEPSGGPVDELPPVSPSAWPRMPREARRKPANPLIDSGAILVSSLMNGETPQEKLHRLLRLIRVISGNPTVRVNEHVYLSEKKNLRNRAIAYLLQEQGCLLTDAEEALDLYAMQCAIEVSCRDLAYMATCLANGGTVWGLSKPVIPRPIVRVLTALMVTCGMYDASGQFAVRVGIPAKSGVSGGILAFVPGKYGIGIFGPALDEKGTSIAGVQLLSECVNQWGWSLFESGVKP